MVNWPTTGRTPGQAMDYIKQIKSFTGFSQFFTDQRNSGDVVKIDNVIFKIHSQYTVMILLVGTMFLSMRQYFGEPIECLSNGSDIPTALLQHYCWLEGTFSVTDATGKASIGSDVAYPGVKTLNEANGERKQSHRYYQWVYFVLIIQSIMFYVPKYLWKAKEANRLKIMITNLKQRHIREWSENETRKLTQDVVDSLLISNDYFFFYFFCEFLYYIHLIAQMWFVNILLSGQFLRLGLEWLTYNHSEDMADPLIRVFPRFTKCLFHKYGYSGSIEKHDSLCFLTLNIVNEKIFVVLWFWFAFLFILTSITLLWRILHVLFPILRYKKICELAPSTDRKSLRMLTSRVGNWFILHHIARNMKPSHFRDLIDILVNDYFDDKCNVVYNKQANNMNAMNQKNAIPQMMNQSVPNQPKQKKGGIKKIGFGKSKGFVTVSRDPPSGHSQDSDEWNMNM